MSSLEFGALSNSITPFAVHLEKIRNHSHQTADNNAKIRSFAPIDIQLREMYPQQGYLHNCKHSIKFQDCGACLLIRLFNLLQKVENSLSTSLPERRDSQSN